MAVPKYKYSFGSLEWRHETYRKDLMILPDGEVISPWRREHGHRLSLDDLTEVLAANPRVLVIGTGALGVMEVSDDLLSALAERGVDAEAMPTEQALKRFKRVRKEKKAAAALHLTC
jgi:hypothetical protein